MRIRIVAYACGHCIEARTSSQQLLVAGRMQITWQSITKDIAAIISAWRPRYRKSTPNIIVHVLANGLGPALSQPAGSAGESVIDEDVVVKKPGLFPTRELFSGLVSI